MVQEVRPESIAEFLVMAARLLLIKSRLLLPATPAEDEVDEEDPGRQLARQLREYKRFKQVAQLLRDRGTQV
jgi:segregation and condensation protein A